MSALNRENFIQSQRARQQADQTRGGSIPFIEYLQLLAGDPLIAQNAPARVLEAIEAEGMEEISERDRWWFGDAATRRYKLFNNKLFGLEVPVSQIMSYLYAGKRRLSSGKALLLLVGPTASGKSSIVTLMKDVLVRYRLRPVYAIEKCPMQEEPLNILADDRELCAQIAMMPDQCSDPQCSHEHMHLGIEIKNHLCPHCRHMIATKHTDDDGTVRWWDVPVVPFRFSVQMTRGIGSFEPSQEVASDVTTLVGRERIQISAREGEDHPLAWSLSGELEHANRGLFEGRELVKADSKILWTFISAAEEQEIKVQGSALPHIGIDEVLVGHTNLTEFKKFSADKTNEALHDRFIVVSVPYALRVQDEERIYEKLIQQESEFARFSPEARPVHIAPGVFALAASFAVMTRFRESKTGVGLLQKLNLYNGKAPFDAWKEKDQKTFDLRHLRKEGQQGAIDQIEGMHGVSPRDVLAALNLALVDQASRKQCLTPRRAMKALREVFQHRMGYAPEELENFQMILSSQEKDSVALLYREFVLAFVNKAFLSAYEEIARSLFDQYVEEAEASRSRTRKFRYGISSQEEDELTGVLREPDEKLLRSIEAHLGIAESEAIQFRGELLEERGRAVEKNGKFSYDDHPFLQEGIRKKLLEEGRSILTAILTPNRSRTQEERKHADDLRKNLEQMGCCAVCREEFIEDARDFLGV